MAFGQPSPQGIASLYRGNPGALDARIKQEQQAKPGMPPDLAKLLALQIDVNEEDAVKRQEAMAALQSMPQTPTGKPPTVAESLQQLALQKAKQLAVQQQRQQQGLQALMGQAAPAQAPERPPQPERQGSIEDLRTNLGENYSGGGIVAFAGPDGSEVEDETVTKKPLRQVTQRELAEEFNRKRWAQQAADDAARSPEAKKDSEGIGKALSFVAALPIEAFKTLVSAPGYGFSKDDTPAPTPAMAPADIRTQLNKAEAKMQPATPAAPVVRDIAALAEQKKRAQNAAAAGTANAPAAPAAPAPMSARDKFLAEQYAMTPAQRREEMLKRYAEQIGGPDTAAQEAYIKALQGRVAGMEEPTDPYERARNYLRKLATAGGRTWQQTGAAASSAMEAERLANEQKKFDLLKEIMGESTKVADVKRGYKKDVFAAGEKEYDDAYKNAFEATKESGLDERQRQLFAHQTAEKVLDRANAIKVAQIQADARGGGSEAKQQLAELKALQTSKTQQLKNAYGSDKKRLQGELAVIEAQIAKMAGLDTMPTAPGAASPGGTRPPLSSFQR